MISINEVQDEVIAEFNDFDDWMDRYQLLIDLGNEQEPLDEKYKTEQNLIEGCQSRVWLQADEVDGKIIFHNCKINTIEPGQLPPGVYFMLADNMVTKLIIEN